MQILWDYLELATKEVVPQHTKGGLCVTGNGGTSSLLYSFRNSLLMLGASNPRGSHNSLSATLIYVYLSLRAKL